MSNTIPKLNCPKENSDFHESEVKEVLSSYNNPHLNKNFLKLSDESVKKIFQKYLNNNNLFFNWKKFKNQRKRIDIVCGKLKDKYKRKRPKHYLIKINDRYNNIKNMSSYSFPSGHTMTAHFIADVLGKLFPEHSPSLKQLAKLIGYSRIENGVHYPSDVWAGQLIGESLAANIDLSEYQKNVGRKEEKAFSKKLRKLAKTYYPKLKEKQQIENYCEDIAQFIEISNLIENYNVDKTFDACLKFILGYPIKYCSDDLFILSHLKMLCASNKIANIDNLSDMKYIHSHIHKNVLDNEKPGKIRTKKNKNKFGNEYAKPNKIREYSNNLIRAKNPFVKHIIFEWIHPFFDGNGRVGRIILAKDLNYNFSKVNYFCTNNYIENIEMFIENHKNLENIFKQ
jgi:hypothetical protein